MNLSPEQQRLCEQARQLGNHADQTETLQKALEAYLSLLKHQTATQQPQKKPTETKITTVIQLYAEGNLSQSKSAEILGFSREQFLQELYLRKIPALQTDAEQLQKDVEWLTASS